MHRCALRSERYHPHPAHPTQSQSRSVALHRRVANVRDLHFDSMKRRVKRETSRHTANATKKKQKKAQKTTIELFPWRSWLPNRNRSTELRTLGAQVGQVPVDVLLEKV